MTDDTFTPGTEDRLTSLRNQLSEIAKQSSARLSAQADARKQPITGMTVKGAYEQAASTDDYQSFMDSPSPLDPAQKTQIWRQTKLGILDAQKEARDDNVFSASEINSSVVAEAANLGIIGVGAVSNFVGRLGQAGMEVAQTVRAGSLDEKDIATVEAVNRKKEIYADARQALKDGESDPEKAAILRARMEAASPLNYTDAEKSIFEESKTTFTGRGGSEIKKTRSSVAERYEMLRKGNALQQDTDKFFSSISDMANTDAMDNVLMDLGTVYTKHADKISKDAVENFEAGNTLNGIGDIISGAAGLTVEGGKALITNPGGLVQLFIQSAPDMAAAAASMPVALAANYIDKQQEAKATYRKVHGTEPIGDGLLKLNGYAFAGALVDTYTDRLVMKGGLDLKKLAAAAGLKTGIKSVDKTVGAVATVSQAAVSGAALEFVSEGGGNLLTQQAGKQGAAPLDFKEAYVEGMAGAGVGGGIATVASALSGSKDVAANVAQKMQVRFKAREEKSIKSMVSDVRSMDIAGATAVMKSIVGSADSTPEQKAEAVRDLETAFAQEAFTKIAVERAQIAIDEGTGTPAQEATVQRGTQILEEMNRARETLKVTKDALKGTSVESAYKTLTSESEVTPEVSRQAASVISDEVNSAYSNISTDMAREILEKRADVLTKDQVSNLRSYVTTNEAFDALTEKLDAGRVRSNIIEGGNGNVGARTYVNAIISSLRLGDATGAKNIAGDLSKFAVRHMAKAVAMKQIIDSFDAGTPLSAQEQITLMAPFNSKAKGSQFRPFTNAVPKYARMIQDEAQMLQIVSNEMNARVGIEPSSSNVTQERVDAEVPGTGTEAETSDVGNIVSTGENGPIPDLSTEQVQQTEAPSSTPQRGAAVGEVSTLQDLLTLPEDEAIEQFRTKAEPAPEDSERFEAGSIPLPESSNMLLRTEDALGNSVEIVEDSDDGTISAILDGEVVAYIGKETGGNTTVLQGSTSLPPKSGIATLITAEFIRRNPNQPAGSFTPEGEATYRRALRKLKGEQSTIIGSVEGTVVPEVSLMSNLLTNEDGTGNIVKDFFRVKDAKVIGNPLINDPQFINKLRTEGVSTDLIKKYLPDGYIVTEAQLNLLNKFITFNEAFALSFEETFDPTPIKVANRSLINHLTDARTGKIKTEVVDAMSLSAFNWLLIKSNDSLIKTNEDLGTLVGIDSKNHIFSNFTWSTLGQGGLPYNEEAYYSMGTEILGTLGLTTTKNAPHTALGLLAQSLGGHAIQALAATTDSVGIPLIKIVNISAQDRNIAHLIENQNMGEQAAFEMVNSREYVKVYKETLKTIQASYEEVNDFRKPVGSIQGMVLEPAKNTGSFLSKLFSNVEAIAAPKFTPVTSKEASKVMKRTDRQISKFAQDVHDKFNSTKTFLKPAMVKVFKQFSEQELAEMFGFRTDLKNKVHKDDLKSETSKNNLIMDNVQKVFQFLDMYQAETNSDDYSAPFYLDHETTSVNRAQLTQRIMNMQSDKIARHMAYRDGWNVIIDVANAAQLETFTLAVGQALGVGLDKTLNKRTLEMASEKLNKPEVVTGINAAVALLNDVATPDQLNDLKAAVMYLGNGNAGLDGIMAYAGYVDALNKGQTSFETNIAVEHDGVTNGPMITLMQFGLANGTWADDLSAGAIYINSNLENVPDAKAQGIKDVYEKVTIRMADKLSRATSIPVGNWEGAPSFKLTTEFKAALSAVFGELTKFNVENNRIDVLKAGRDLAKPRVTAKTYQAGDPATKQKLGDEAIKNIRASLVEYATVAANPNTDPTKVMEVKLKAKALADALNELAPGLVTVPKKNGKKDYLNAVIGETTIYAYESTDPKRPIKMTFAKMVSATYGTMFTESVNEQNILIAQATEDAVRVSNIAVMAYEVARTILLGRAKQAKLDATVDETNFLLRELTNAEVQVVESQLESMFPEVYTALSKQKGFGVSLVSKGKDRNVIESITEIKLTEAAAPSYNLDGTKVKAPKASTIASPGVTVEAPGVTGVVNDILATDGTIMLVGGIAKHPESINLYDAHMSGIGVAGEVSKDLNRAMFDIMVNHSVPKEIANMSLRAIKGLRNLVGDNFTFSEDLLKKYKIKEGSLNSAALAEARSKQGKSDNNYVNVPLNTVYNASLIINQFKKQADYLHEVKRKALLNSKVVINHYYTEGSAVTFINGTEVDATTLTDSEMTQEFVASVGDAIVAVKDSAVGNDIAIDDSLHAKELGTNAIDATADNNLETSPEMVEAFTAANGVMTVQEAVALMDTLSINSPTINAVKAITKNLLSRVKSDLKVVMYESGKVYTGDLAWINTNTDVIQYSRMSRGMFVDSAFTGNSPVILLMADTMPHSGMNKETLFHELVHHLFDQRVFNSVNSPVTNELQNLVHTVKKELPTVLANDPEAKQFVDSFDNLNRLPALSNMREFVAWGLSSSSFQRILSQVAYASVKELDNKLGIKPRTVMTKLRDLVQKVIFNRDIKATTNEPIDNALKALLTVSLKTQEGIVGRVSKPGISRQHAPMNRLYSVTKLNSIGIFNSLASTGFVKTAASHQAHLENMLNSVVNVVLNPLNVDVISTATNESINELSAHDKLQIFVADNAGLQLSNLPPQYGFNKSAQELYVHGLYLNILEEGLSVGSPHLNAANDFFNKAASALTYKDFMIDPTDIDPAVIKSAQDRYDSVFSIKATKIQSITDQSSGLSFEKQKSDYLRNFLALAATNQQFRNALNNIPMDTKVKPTTLFEKIVDFLTTVIDWVSDRIVGVDNTKSTVANIDMLTKRLVGVELEAQSQLEKAFNLSVEYSSTALGGALDVFKKGLYKLGSMPVFAKSKFSGIRLASGLARITGNNKTQHMFDVAGEMFARLNKGKQTFAGALIDEVKGTTRDNSKVHSLLRIANFTLDRGRKAVIETMTTTLDRQFKGKLTNEERAAITKAVLRTDMAALIDQGYGLDNMADLLTDSAYLNAEIQAYEDKLAAVVPSNIATFYMNQAEDLGFAMVKGFSSNAASIPNAYGIARLWGTQQGEPDASTVGTVEPLIDALATLQAIKWFRKTGTKARTAAEVIRREITRTDGDNGPDNNGMVFVLKQHQDLKAKALKDNFNGKGALMRKGYMPDITNPYIDVQPASVIDRDEMKRRGYKEMYLLEKDATDPAPGAMALFVGDGAGLTGYMRGALSTTGKAAKGNRIRDYGDVAVMQANKYSAVQKLFSARISPSDTSTGVHMQALFNEDGMVVDYRYTMAEATKDTLLSRNENFSEVLGALAGSVYDKAMTKPHNEQMIDVLKEQYDLDISEGKADMYLRVSGRSTDKELKDLYNMLPYETRQYAQQVFGTDSIPVRAEFIPIVFGYRKLSIGQLWQDGGVDNNLFQNAVKAMFDALFGAAGMQRATQLERGLQDLVRIAKSNVVVRMGEITLANLVSNTYDLVVNGLTVKEAIADQVTGYKKGIEYVRHGQRIAELDLLLKADHNPAERNKMINERTQLKHLQSINPVAELIEAGLLQTIVMDVANDTDPFSYSSIIANKIDAQLDRLPEQAADATKFVFMTRDSASFEFMNKITQFSDFAARYALYKQLTTRKNNPMDKSSAIQAVIDQFVNYDLPTHKAIQYGNDIGLIWFSRYWLRIQKIIVKNFAENPARVLLGLSAQGILGEDLPDNTDSSILATGPLHPLRGFGGIWSGLMSNPVLPN
jgi:hypothetical protein